MKLFEKNFSRTDIEKYTGNIYQIAGTRHYELTEGRRKGTRAIDINTGSGFSFTVLPDRALDISLASYKGINLVYLAPNGEVNPAYYNPHGNEWLHSFFAGLLTTCGLSNISNPCVDENEELGLHGRIANTPAERLCDNSEWSGDEYLIEIKGEMKESVLFGSKLEMKRKITAIAGQKCLKINDTVRNYGSCETPFSILYHINAGFPLLDEGSELIVSSRKVEPYDGDEVSSREIDHWHEFTEPQGNFNEQNFLHTMLSDEDGYGLAAIINRKLLDGIGLYIKYKTDTLPYLSEWKMLGDVDYIVAIEPCNVPCQNRLKLRNQNRLQFIKPGETKEIELEIGVLDGGTEINNFKNKIDALKEA
jgi:hypothetical protein